MNLRDIFNIKGLQTSSHIGLKRNKVRCSRVHFMKTFDKKIKMVSHSFVVVA